MVHSQFTVTTVVSDPKYVTREFITTSDFKKESDQALAAKISEAWIAFARTGNPRTTALPWPAYTRDGRQIMVLNNESRTAYDPSVAERHAWIAMYTGLSSMGA